MRAFARGVFMLFSFSLETGSPSGDVRFQDAFVIWKI